MLFKKYRQRRWKSKLYAYTEKALILIKMINSGRQGGEFFTFEEQLVKAKYKIGKYRGLLEMSKNEFEDYESKIKEILNK